jgi:peptidoglycan/xylan/chitin deacetylase (PgdA/CDA1 family)
MQAFSLMYHDVVTPGGYHQSGIQGADADIYKLDRELFRRHLDAIAALGLERVKTCIETPGTTPPVLLTFDDGGSCFPWIADELERRGWRGHFFITTNWIGTPGFVTTADLRAIAAKGHVVGSHSCSHPPRISALPPDEIAREWRDSVKKLSDILGSAVPVASVPGGFYSRQVGEFAVQAGVSKLFTSEPTTHTEPLGEGLLYGRFFVQNGMSPEFATSFAGGPGGHRLRQAAVWKLKKVAKSLGGELYLKVRRAYIKRQER